MPERALQAQPLAVAEARGYVRQRLAETLSSERLAEAELLTSELVSNALRHAQLGDEAEIRVEIEIEADSVRVSVVDAGAGFDFGKMFWEPPEAGGGWGLSYVEALADRWGIDASPPHSVWFEMER